MHKVYDYVLKQSDVKMRRIIGLHLVFTLFNILHTSVGGK